MRLSLKLLLVLTALLTLGTHFNYARFLVKAHVQFYQDLSCVIDPSAPEDQVYIKYFERILLDRFLVTQAANGKIDDTEIQNIYYNGDAQYITIQYEVNGEEGIFTSRYPWKSNTQQVYEAEYLGLNNLIKQDKKDEEKYGKRQFAL
jgi:hypothetical protein